MKVILQRVNSATVSVDDKITAEISKGYLLLVGFGKSDTEVQLHPLAEKIINLRLFPDEKGRFHLSLKDTNSALLVVSQFTLYANTNEGRRPSFSEALEPEKAKELYLKFIEVLKTLGVAKVAEGVFGAYMKISLENDGPVTILLET